MSGQVVFRFVFVFRLGYGVSWLCLVPTLFDVESVGLVDPGGRPS